MRFKLRLEPGDAAVTVTHLHRISVSDLNKSKNKAQVYRLSYLKRFDRIFWLIKRYFVFSSDTVWGETVVHMRKVTHHAVQMPLSSTAVLPCVFALHPAPGQEPPRIKWTKIWGHRGLDGLQREQSVLVAKGNVIKVKKAFQGRVTLPGYTEDRYNASLALTGLRSSDSGMYRCEVVVGINDEQDTVPLQVTGERTLMSVHGIALLTSLSFLPQENVQLSGE